MEQICPSNKYYQGSIQNENMPDCGKKRGTQAKNQRVYNLKFRLFWYEGGGGSWFLVFQTSKDWNLALILIMYGWDIGDK